MEPRSILAYTFLPAMSELTCTTCELYPSDVRTSLLFHSFYICRFILTEISDVLVAPNNIDNTITIISAKKDCILKKIGLIPILNDNLRILDEKVLLGEIYDSCLSYSILIKMSPAWIKVDRYFIQSEDFISYNQAPNAVEVDVSRYSEKLLLLRLRSVVINIESYFEPKTCTPRCWNRYNESKTGCINMSLSQQVYVLPSMKRGNIVSISKSIVDGNSIRGDWLNQYGYLLPNENELSYCKVKHLDSEQDIMIYPSVCLLAKPLHIVDYSMDSRTVIASFLRTLIINNQTICGQILELMGTQEVESKLGIQKTEENVENNQSDKQFVKTEKQKFDISNFCVPNESSSQSTFQNDNSEIVDVGETSENNGTNKKFEWEECHECSLIDSCTQNYDTVVTVPFDLDSIKSIQYPTSTTKSPESSKKRLKHGRSSSTKKS